MGASTAVIGAGVLGAGATMYGAQQQSEAMGDAADAQERSTARQIAFQKEMHRVGRKDLEPYRLMARSGMHDISGLWGIPQQDYARTSQNALHAYRNYDEAPDPTQAYSAGQNALAGIRENYGRGSLPNQNLGMNLDPATGLPEDIDLEFDPNDEVYQWKQQEAAKRVNQNLAAKGLLNSSAAVNALSDAQKAVTADEIDRQYGRAVDRYGREADRARYLFGTRYGQAGDLYNRGMQQSNVLYGRAGDDFSRAYGLERDLYDAQNRANLNQQARLQNLYNMTNQLGTQEYNRDLRLAQMGLQAAGGSGDLAMQTGANVGGALQNYGTNMSNIAIQQGQNQANMWNNLGAMPMNALATYNYMQPGQTTPGKGTAPIHMGSRNSAFGM